MSRSHLPKPIYQHLDDSFFHQLCPFNVTSFGQTSQDSIIDSYKCACEGNNYYGMPDIDFALYIDEYRTGAAYSLQPADFEMYPKVSTESESYCQLGLWSLYTSFPD